MWWLNWLSKFFAGTIERPSPSDWLPSDAINIINGSLVVNLNQIKVKLDEPPKVWIPSIPDTNSMDGVFDIGNNNILIAGRNSNDHIKLIAALEVGDIAVYGGIIHRIVESNSDEQGRYFSFKGDNNAVNDSGKIRDSQISWISIGTIY